MRREPDPEAIVARARTRLVFPSQAAPVATITGILTCWTEPPLPEGVAFTGPVRFSEDTQKHARATVLPLVHRICRLLGLAPGGFEISAVNLAAASQLDVGLEISGFSADLPLFLAMLSARLRVPVPQEVMCTGHIASQDGDVRMVQNLLSAAARNGRNMAERDWGGRSARRDSGALGEAEAGVWVGGEAGAATAGCEALMSLGKKRGGSPARRAS
ncbi:MAG: hypothetical protein FJW34_20815 [Acidobacteria bacterium]|nr:hypothetical protein [Acidobacteriota bacterium]